MKKYYEDFQIGETARSAARTVTEEDILGFIACTGDTHPIHVDQDYCRQHPLVRDCVAQGVLVLGIADGMMAREILPDETLLIHCGCDRLRFVRPVYAGDKVHIEAAVIRKQEKNETFGAVCFRVHAYNQDDALTLCYDDKMLLERDPTVVSTQGKEPLQGKSG